MDSKRPEFHGWGPAGGQGTTLSIGYLPGRKRVALYVTNANLYVATLNPVAYFTSERDALETMAILDAMILRLPPSEPERGAPER